MLLNLYDKNPLNLLTALRDGMSLRSGLLQLELLGPGSVLPDTALMLFHELRARPSTLGVHVHSHTCLFDGAILLWLAADTRSLRPDAWIQVSRIPETPPTGRTIGHRVPDYAASINAEDECPADTDLRSVMDHLEEWLPVDEIAGLRLFPQDLNDLGLLDSKGTPDPISEFFNVGRQPVRSPPSN